MKPTVTKAVEFTGNLEELGLERHKFGFDPEAIQALMDMMTDNYGDPILAFMRELSTNARDSHVDAGKADQPIEVTLPTQLLPEFKVQDYGTGLSPEDAVGTFTLYGYSTKRDSDLFNGMLGIGAKSPLAYADAFTVVARKDGVQTTLIISRDEDGVGGLEELIEPTTEPDGVCVSVPVKQSDVNAVHEKADQFYPFWTSKVLIDGEPPKQELPFNFKRINDELALKYTGYYKQDSYIVMGDVPYRVSDGVYKSIEIQVASKRFDPYVDSRYTKRRRYDSSRAYSFVLWVEIGDIEFAPSREDVKMKGGTIDVLEAFPEYVKEYAPRMFWEMFSKLEFADMLEIKQHDSLFHQIPLLWGYKTPPSYEAILNDYREITKFTFEVGHGPQDLTAKEYFADKESRYYRYGVSFRDLQNDQPTIVLQGFKPRGWSRNHISRVIQCVEEDLDKKITELSGIKIAVNGPAQQEYVDFDLVLDWEDVKARTKIHKRKRSLKQRIKGTRIYSMQEHVKTDGTKHYRYWRQTGIETLDKSRPMMWMKASEDMTTWQRDYVAANEPAMQALIVYSKELSAFQKLHPDVPHYEDWIKKTISGEVASLNYKDLFYVLDEVTPPLCNVGWRKIPALDLKGMRDVRLRRCLERAHQINRAINGWAEGIEKDDADHLQRMQRTYGQWAVPSAYKEVLLEKNKKQYEIYLEVKERMREDYPLIEYCRSTDVTIEYVNAMHKHRGN